MTCATCHLVVHEACYGPVPATSSDTPWQCMACRLNVVDPPCVLCPVRGGACKPLQTDRSRFVHIVCTLAHPEVFMPADVPGVVAGAEQALASWYVSRCWLMMCVCVWVLHQLRPKHAADVGANVCILCAGVPSCLAWCVRRVRGPVLVRSGCVPRVGTARRAQAVCTSRVAAMQGCLSLTCNGRT